MSDIRDGKAGLVPTHLRDGHYSGATKLGNAMGYVYRTMTRMGLCRNSIHPMNWSASTTTGQRATVQTRDRHPAGPAARDHSQEALTTLAEIDVLAAATRTYPPKRWFKEKHPLTPHAPASNFVVNQLIDQTQG